MEQTFERDRTINIVLSDKIRVVDGIVIICEALCPTIEPKKYIEDFNAGLINI